MNFYVFFYFTGLLISLLFLWLAGDLSVKYSVQTADKFNLNKLFVGFVLIAVATGFPELSVVITSVFRDVQEISAGTILGSNICDISLVLGIALLCYGALQVNEKERKDSLFLLFVTSFTMTFVFIIGNLNLISGVILVLLYFTTIWLSWKNSTKKEIKTEEKIQAKIVKNHEPFLTRKWGVFLKLLVSIVFLLLVSEFAVRFAMLITKALSLSLETVGATILAVGTSLPELSLAVNAMKKKEYSLALGNSLGSVLEQGTFLLGILAVFSKRTIDVNRLNSLVIFMFLSFFIIGFNLIKRRKMNRIDGVIMLIIFVIFIFYQFFWVR